MRRSTEEMNALVATEIMGYDVVFVKEGQCPVSTNRDHEAYGAVYPGEFYYYPKKQDVTCFHGRSFSPWTSIADAMEVLDRFCEWEVRKEKDTYWAMVADSGVVTRTLFSARRKVKTQAICLASLRAKGVEV